MDCWEGDPQAGFYGDEVYRTFLGRIEQLKLGSIILPLKMYFDEALNHVEKPIDLLHIDGLHTWEAVNHDFDTFGPLVRPGGLVIFHDVNRPGPTSAASGKAWSRRTTSTPSPTPTAWGSYARSGSEPPPRRPAAPRVSIIPAKGRDGVEILNFSPSLRVQAVR